MRSAVPPMVTSRTWWHLVLYVSFALACLASLGCALASMSACLYINSTIILSLLVVKSLNPVFILFFKTVLFPIFVPIPCISTIFLCSYRFPVSVSFFRICTDLLYRYCFHVSLYTIVISILLILSMLLLDTWLLHAITWPCLLAPYTCLISLITLHLTICLVIIIFWESLSCYPVIYTVTCISSTYVLLLLL